MRREIHPEEGCQVQEGGTTGRTPETRHGTIRFKLAKVKHLENGSMLTPFLLYIGLEPWRRIVDDLYFECAETAAILTYRDSKTVIENLTKAKVFKNRIHSCVLKAGAFTDKERGEAGNGKADLLYADGSEAHGYNGEKNEVNVIVGKNTKTSEKNLLGLTVNGKWKETTEQLNGKADVLISDATRR